AFEDRLLSLGFELSKEELDKAFEQFKLLADKKKVVSDLDIAALVQPKAFDIPETYKLKRFVINSGNTITATATVRLETAEFPKEAVATGDGPIDAAFKAIDEIVGIEFRLDAFTINALSEGKDA